MIEAPELKAIGSLRHGFFTREGGVSSGIYGSLNCGLGSDDDPALVRENRSRVAGQLGIAPGQFVSPYQIHSDKAVLVHEPWRRESAPRADALVTTTPGLAIGIATADCAPVLFAEPDAGIVGAAHAGWQGALGGVLEATVALMEREGGDRAKIVAAVGPAISGQSYEVGEEFRDRFVNANAENAKYFSQPREGAKPHFALSQFVSDRLRTAGVGVVEDLEICTYRDETRLFSYRRTTHRSEPDYGRQISAIVLT